jgi:hypothetical protein
MDNDKLLDKQTGLKRRRCEPSGHSQGRGGSSIQSCKEFMLQREDQDRLQKDKNSLRHRLANGVSVL